MDTPKVVAPFTSVEEILGMLRPQLCSDAYNAKHHLDCSSLVCENCVMNHDGDVAIRIQWVKDNMFKQGK